MGKLIFAAIVLILGFTVHRVLAWIVPTEPRFASRARLMGFIGHGAAGTGVVVAAVTLFFSMFVSVDSGHVGVVTVFGNVEPEPLYNGLRIVMPWKDVRQMSIQILKHEGKCDAVSIDIQAVHTVMAINFSIRPDKAPELYRSIGLSYETAIIDPAASEVLKANTAIHAANDILQQRQKIKVDVQTGLTVWLAKYNIDVREVSIKDIRFNQDFERAVEQKQIAQQVAQQKKYEVEQAVQAANAKVAQQRGEGDAAKAKADGDAAALRITGTAQAEYNRNVAASLTPVLIQRVYLDKWDGKLPQYMLGGGANILLGLPHDK